MIRSLRPFVAGAVLAIVLAASCGSPYVTPTPSPSPTAVPTASTSPTPAAPSVTHDVVYFARDRLPPVGGHVSGAGAGAIAADRIRSRLDALFAAPAPPGLFNVARSATARPASVRLEGDLAVVDFTAPNDMWGVAGSAGTRAFIQQLVYTITEEPGVQRALITQNGGQLAIVDGEGVVIDHPSGRADVSGYVVTASLDPIRSFEGAPPLVPAADLAATYTVDVVAPALARVLVELARPHDDGRWMPTFDVSVMDGASLGTKHELRLTVFDGLDRASDVVVDRTPLRRLKVERAAEPAATLYRLGLDDLRPWRVAVAFEPVRIVVDVGGDPDAVSDNIAVYRPSFAEQLTPAAKLSGMTRAFEAAFEYRLSDVFREPLATGHGTASYGTSAVWGMFELALGPVPANTANVEVVLRSPRDGEITDIVWVAVGVAR